MSHRLRSFVGLAALLTGACVPSAPGLEGAPEPALRPSVTTDVVYGHKDGLALTFDVHRPAHPNGAGVIAIVSGGWQSSVEMSRLIVDGPVLVIPGRGGAASDSRGAVVIPDVGTVYFHAFRASGDWGTLEAENGVLVASDGRTRRVPAPIRRDDGTFSGDGWTFKAATGWTVREGARRGDYEVVRQP